VEECAAATSRAQATTLRWFPQSTGADRAHAEKLLPQTALARELDATTFVQCIIRTKAQQSMYVVRPMAPDRGVPSIARQCASTPSVPQGALIYEPIRPNHKKGTPIG
jgi:hypothetical protein